MSFSPEMLFTALDGTAIAARLVREIDLACDEEGHRILALLGEAIQFYESQRLSEDPLGHPVGLRFLDSLEQFQQKDGKLVISSPKRYRGRRQHLSVRTLKLAKSEADRLLDWVADYLESVDYDRQAESFAARPRLRLRPSSLAEGLGMRLDAAATLSA